MSDGGVWLIASSDRWESLVWDEWCAASDRRAQFGICVSEGPEEHEKGGASVHHPEAWVVSD